MKKKLDVDNEITILKKEIDKIKNSTVSKNMWYKNISTLISLLALLISFGTTIVSFFHTRVQDIENRQAELRGIFQRMSALPKENMEALKLYNNSPDEARNLSAYINQENALLINQAIDIINSLPNKCVTATDYFALSNALINSYMPDKALYYIKQAITVASCLETEIALLKTYGMLLFSYNKFEEGRQQYKKTVDSFSKYSTINQITAFHLNIQNELDWARIEINYKFNENALVHLKKAKEIYTLYMEQYPRNNILEQSIAFTEEMMKPTFSYDNSSPYVGNY